MGPGAFLCPAFDKNAKHKRAPKAERKSENPHEIPHWRVFRQTCREFRCKNNVIHFVNFENTRSAAKLHACDPRVRFAANLHVTFCARAHVSRRILRHFCPSLPRDRTKCRIPKEIRRIHSSPLTRQISDKLKSLRQCRRLSSCILYVLKSVYPRDNSSSNVTHARRRRKASS